jgi:hypothetical protein
MVIVNNSHPKNPIPVDSSFIPAGMHSFQWIPVPFQWIPVPFQWIPVPFRWIPVDSSIYSHW